MFVYRSGAQVEIWAPAKLNLFLEVLSKRQDGFHEIETLMTAVSIFDTLYFVVDDPGPITLTCDWACGLRRRHGNRPSPEYDGGLGDLPEGTDNIVMRAVELVRRCGNVELGAHVRLVKRIPSASGMGGASSDAAAALVAANHAWQLGMSLQRLGELAAELGSDVPFFLGTGVAVCRGRGERIRAIPNSTGLHFVVVRPPTGLSTAQVYDRCRPTGQPRQVEELTKRLAAGNAPAAAKQMVNRLESAAASMSPWVGRLRGEMDALDCLGHQMSGSGTSYFAICRNRRHARRAVAHLRNRRVGRVWYARNIPHAGTSPCELESV